MYVLEWLLGSPPAVFPRGELVLSVGWPLFAGAVALAGLAVWFLLGYRDHGQRLDWPGRLLLTVVRTGALALVLLCLLRPQLVLSRVIPQENLVGVLLDDSASMRIRDLARGEESRAEALLRTFEGNGPGAGDLGTALSGQFVTRLFRFSESVERVASASGLSFAGVRTDLAAALADISNELASLPLAGIVLLTDGAAAGGEALEEVLLELRARGVRVYPVPFGSSRFETDIQLGAPDVPTRVLRGSLLEIRIPVRARGLSGRTARIEVLDEGRIAAVEPVRFADDEVETAVTLLVPAETAGPRRFRFRVAPAPNETVLRNNERRFLLQVEDRVVPILHFEGQPRWEFKYLRRAVFGDEQLRVAGLVRTAEGKFYRVEVTDEDELAGGFPGTREELFRYAAVILGSVEASFFTQDQLNMLRDLVSRRGGGLLTLGGGNAYRSGGYRGTPLAEVLPIVLGDAEEDRDDETTARDRFRELAVTPTRAGGSHPVVQLDPDPLANEDRYRTLPLLSSVNLAAVAKPGAVTLLEGTGPDGTREPVLLYQRYGRGRTASLTVQDLWLWQMGAEVGVDDQTHELFWRRLLRWLTAQVPRRLQAWVSPPRPAPGEEVEIRARVEDERFLAVNDAVVEAALTRPDGETQSIPLVWTGQVDGEYQGTAGTDAAGIYRIEVRAGGAGLAPGSPPDPAEAFFEAGTVDDEYFDAEADRDLLARIAEATGGRVFAPDEGQALVADLSLAESGATVIERRDLWNVPLIFFLVFGLLAVEWSFRAVSGLP